MDLIRSFFCDFLFSISIAAQNVCETTTSPVATTETPLQNLTKYLSPDYFINQYNNKYAAPQLTIPKYTTPLYVDHNQLGKHRQNILFVSVEYHDTKNQPIHPVTSDGELIEFMQKLIDKNGWGFQTSDGYRYGLFGIDPFLGKESSFNFWIYNQKLITDYPENFFCYQNLPPITELIKILQDNLKDFNEEHWLVVFLVPISCLPQGTWLDLQPLHELIQNPAKKLTQILQEWVINLNTQPLIKKYLRPLQTPWIVMDYPNNPNHWESLFVYLKTFQHEFGHAFGHLFDLYEMSELSQLEGLFNDLNQTQTLDDPLEGIFEIVEPLLDESQKKWFLIALIGASFIPYTYNPIKLLLRDPNIETVLGAPLGFPHCAIDQEEADHWWGAFRGQGKDETRIGTTDNQWYRGCFYFGENFLRPSENSMMRSGSEFDPVEKAYLLKRINSLGSTVKL